MTTRTYETMVLLDNQEVKRNWNALKDQVTGLFTKHGSSIRSAKVWEERRLAYPIERQLRATYFLVYHDGVTDNQTALTRDLEYAEPVLRHMTVACDEIPADALEGADDFDPEQVRVESVEMAAEALAQGGDDEAAEDGEGEGDADGEKSDEESSDEGESKDGESGEESGEAKDDDAKGDDEETKE